MKHTAKEIIELSKKILNNSGFGYDDENQIKCVELNEDSFWVITKIKTFGRFLFYGKTGFW